MSSLRKVISASCIHAQNHIIDFLLYTPILRVSIERYEADDVIVTVEWTPHEGVTYTTSVSPLTSIIITGSSSRQLTILYNTDYNLSVEAAPPCRPNSTAVIALKYGEAIDNLWTNYCDLFVPIILLL